VNFCIKGKDLSLFSAAEQARIELLKDLDDDDNFSGDADIEGVKYINIHVDKKKLTHWCGGETTLNTLQGWRNWLKYLSAFQPAALHRNVAFPVPKAKCLRTVRELNKKCFIKENFDLIKEKVVKKFGLERKV
jgi:hypothetical protein